MDEITFRGDSKSAESASDIFAFASPSCDSMFWRAERIGLPSAWWQHVAFGHWIVSVAEPRVLVELGTHSGVSYSAFCQGVRRSNLDTRCYAVDTWKGDPHAENYGEDVYEEFSRFHDARYAEFSTLLRMSFDEALNHFTDGCVDFLHIDGFHTYEAVKHDFESWRAKLSQRAVVLFHDTNVHEKDFGVWRLWAELREQFPHFEFLHGYGLGVLAVGEDVEPAVLDLCRLSDPSTIASVRGRFSAIGERFLSQTREEMLVRELKQKSGDVAAARRELDNANLRTARAEQEAEQERQRAEQAEKHAERAQQRVDRVKQKAEQAEQLQRYLEQAEIRHEQVKQERDALLSSTLWKATWPVRMAAQKLPPGLRRAARAGTKLAWWSLTMKLPQKLREPDAARASVPGPEAAMVQALPDDSRRIVYVSGEPDTPGHFYRVVYPLAASALGSTWMRADEIPSRLQEIESARILILWRAVWNENVEAAVNCARRRGATVIFDIDDLMFDPGLARVDVIDGIRSQGLTESSVRTHYELVRQTMQAADVCMATTEELAFHLRMAGKTTHVLPNGFDQSCHDVSRRAVAEWRQKGEDDLIRIGYAGGSPTHQRDLGLAIEAVGQILRENPACRLVLFRSSEFDRPLIDTDEYPALNGLEDRIEWRSAQPLPNLPFELARFDINLAPLEFGNPFCEAKSELKFFEAALVDVPTVASPTGPFRRAIEHGDNGLLAANANDWYVCLKRLVEDSDLRRRIGRRAYHTALAINGPVQRAARLGRIVDQVLGGTPASNAFAQQAYLATRPRQLPAVFDSEIVFERDATGYADVTVVIPLHNYEGYVVEALDSVRRQTLRPIDLVVVDDASTDNSQAVAKVWAERNAACFNRIVVLQNRANYGLAFSRNAGFDAARSTYVLPLDADNVLDPKCCEVLLETLRGSGAAYAYSTIQHFGDCSGFRSHLPYDPQRFVGGNYIDAMALVSKEAWAVVGGYVNACHGWEDFDFWCCLAEHGLKGVWRPEVLARYRVHQASMTKEMTQVENYARLMANLKQRHPWVSLVEQHMSRRFPVPDSNFIEPAAQTRLDMLLPLLRCPVTKSKLAYNADRTALLSVDGLKSWPICNGRPVLSSSATEPRVYPEEHLSNDLPEVALDLIRRTEGMVLNLSAGGSREKFDHVVEVEYGIFRHTDLVGDAHELPFYDETFEAIIVMNAFEHYREPHKVAAELFRLLKPDGRVLVHTAFMQPLHEAPWHFFNCTRYGLIEWFKGFQVERVQVSDNFCPNHSIAWLASELEGALARDISEDSAKSFASTQIGALVEMWRDPTKRATTLWTDFCRLSQPAQEITAAGFEFIGRKAATDSQSWNIR